MTILLNLTHITPQRGAHRTLTILVRNKQVALKRWMIPVSKRERKSQRAADRASGFGGVAA
jgi:hypothetical protein